MKRIKAIQFLKKSMILNKKLNKLKKLTKVIKKTKKKFINKINIYKHKHSSYKKNQSYGNITIIFYYRKNNHIQDKFKSYKVSFNKKMSNSKNTFKMLNYTKKEQKMIYNKKK